MKADEVAHRYSGRKLGLTVRILEDEEQPPDPTVLLEGSPEALTFLAELLMAVAGDQRDDGFEISPKSAGRAQFSRESTLGIYIHRLQPRAAARRSSSIGRSRRDLKGQRSRRAKNGVPSATRGRSHHS